MCSLVVKFTLLAAVCRVAWSDTLHITADNELESICVNGQDQGVGENYKTVRSLDHMPLPASWNDDALGCITVAAVNYAPRTAAGILACVSSSTAPTGLNWQCIARNELGGASCCSSCGSDVWETKHGENVLSYLPNQKHNRDYKDKLPDGCVLKRGQTLWVWDNLRKQPHVCCRARPCGNLCSGCDWTGPGMCDVGQCLFGAVPATALRPFTEHNLEVISVAKLQCQYKCCIEVTTSPDNSIYPTLKITNAASGTITEHTSKSLTLNFLLDITTCWYYDTDTSGVSNPDEGPNTNANNWVSYLGFVGVTLESGGNQWVALFHMDGTTAALFAEPNAVYYTYSRVSFCATGYPGNDMPAISDMVKIE